MNPLPTVSTSLNPGTPINLIALTDKGSISGAHKRKLIKLEFLKLDFLVKNTRENFKFDNIKLKNAFPVYTCS